MLNWNVSKHLLMNNMLKAAFFEFLDQNFELLKILKYQ